MNNGYAGKILRVDLTTRTISTIPTNRYIQWGGGHGMGSAIFWDLVKDKTISGFDPANVVTIMTSPLGVTLAPAASGRTEVQGIGVQFRQHVFKKHRETRVMASALYPLLERVRHVLRSAVCRFF